MTPDKRGLAARLGALELVLDVLGKGLALDERYERFVRDIDMPADDKALARGIATVTVRRFGSIRHAIEARLQSGWPEESERLQAVLSIAVAQILFMDVKDHASVDIAVNMTATNTLTKRWTPLANAILRRIVREQEAIRDELAGNPLLDMPEWLTERWTRRFGEAETKALAASLRHEPALDLSFKGEPTAGLEGVVLPSGSFRLTTGASIETLPGFKNGDWWVQDAAAAQAAALLAPKAGERILDLCAAPGGKTAQLAAAGAHVTAVDRSPQRMKRLKANLERLALAVEQVISDGTDFMGEPFDAVLIDAPCSATGTIRRHPEIAWNRTLEDIARMALLQGKLLDRAAALLRPGGRLVFCTCSLEHEEGEAQVEAFLKRHPSFDIASIEAKEAPGFEKSITSDGVLRILPHHLVGPERADVRQGSDGFFMARMQKTS
jgi:16S rRNA (cytosine967-C5)-methyltransferase